MLDHRIHRKKKQNKIEHRKKYNTLDYEKHRENKYESVGWLI